MFVLLASISHLQKTDNSCARLSIWHTRAYVIGVQTALQLLNVDVHEDALELERFGATLHEKFGAIGSEYDAVWHRAASPKDSADLFLAEWESFVITGKVGVAKESPSKIDGVIDLTADLPNVELKPRFYFATPDITYLKAWFDGVRFVSTYFGGLPIQPDIEAFDSWLRRQTVSNPSCPWEMILTSMCGGDVALAFTKFFEELRRFNQTSVVSCELK